MGEALFSLELALETVKLNDDITCRFPAVAFRLLDFPTLIIYHVEPGLAKTIKERLASDSSNKLSPQLPQLKDKNGEFLIQRGKSCLFKISPDALHKHLSSTPLYVMMIDTYPNVPKLIGSCSVPLNASMDLIIGDINRQGISVPSVRGEQGVFKVFNLMGVEIGCISLAFRLLSLGMGLIPHIPNRAIAKMRKKVVEQDNHLISEDIIDKTQHDTELADEIIKDIQAADKMVQVAMSPVTLREQQFTQTTEKVIGTMAVQTDKRARIMERQRKRLPKQKTRAEPEDDFFVVNTVCPPPLFFNSEAPDPAVSSGLTFHDHPFKTGQTLYTEFGDSQPVDPVSFDLDDFSEEDTIRAEDNFDSDMEDHVDFKSSRITRTETSHILKTETRKTFYSLAESNQTQPSVAVRSSGSVVPIVGNLTQFPMLNALLNEIVALQGQVPGKLSTQPVSHPSIPPSIPSQPPAMSPPFTPPASPPPKMRSKAEREAVLARLATPRGSTLGTQSGRKYSHQSCQSTGDISRGSFSSRRDSQVSVKKTKLAYGMTNTQRLRLAKMQPELLKELEQKEAERIAKRRAEKKGKQPPASKDEPELRPDSMADLPHLNGVSMYSSYEETADISGRTSSEWKKKPVPTPRKSVQMKKNSYHFSDMSDYMMSLSHSQMVTEAWPEESQESNKVHSAGSSNGKLHAAGVTNASVDGVPAEYKAPNVMGLTRTINNPGFPLDMNLSRGSMVSRGSLGQYSAYSSDFDHSHMASSAEELGFRKFVEKYSSSSVSSGDGVEPSLKRVVDSYSQSESNSEMGEEPELRRFVETNSDKESAHSGVSEKVSDSYYTASSSDAEQHRHAAPQSVQQPSQSHAVPHSPQIPMLSSVSPAASILPHAAYSKDVLGSSSLVAATESFESTAYITRSQVPSDTESISVDTRVTQRPKPSPRRMLDRKISVNTESVSSYEPSDADPSDAVTEENEENSYSDEFESDSDSVNGNQRKAVSELQVDPRAQMGYTWS